MSLLTRWRLLLQKKLYIICSIFGIARGGTGRVVALYQRVDVKGPFITRALPLKLNSLWRQAAVIFSIF